MATEKLHEGVWMRQVFKGRKTVRISFIPDDPLHQTLTAKIAYDAQNKTAWEKLLGNPALDIDLGTILIRFNSDDASGIATFLPNQSSQAEVIHLFQPSLVNDHPHVLGTPQFVQCMNSKESLLGAQFNYPVAFAECFPLLFQ